MRIKTIVYLFIIIALVSTAILAGCEKTTAPVTPDTTPEIQSTPVADLTPASFELISLNINPAEIMAGDIITATAEIKNTGDVEGIYKAVITLDGEEIGQTEINIAPGETDAYNHTFSIDDAGIYRINMDELSGILIIKDDNGLPSGSILEKNLYFQDDSIEIWNITYLSDGIKIKGYIAQPRTSGIYPAIIWNRGGNRDFGMLQPNSLKTYAKHNYVAIGSQYRGSPGSQGVDQFGGKDVNDIINLIPVLKSMPNVNIDQIAMVGYSRGGMMTYMCLKQQTVNHTNYIKAACTVGGVADLFMTERERPDMSRNVMIPLIGGASTQMPKEYEARSATHWAEMIDVPLLIQHGEDDESVSVEQSEKLAEELEKYNKFYKLITYPEGDHSLSDYGSGIGEIYKWLDQYLK